MKRYLAIGVLALAPLTYAQELKLGVFDRLKDKASEQVNVNLPKNLIAAGTGLLGLSDDEDVAKLKKLAEGLNSIIVKSLEFEKDGAYTEADVKQLIAELGAPGWNVIISVDEKKEKSRVWVKLGGNGEVGGLRLLVAEPNELTVAAIDGKIRPEDLQHLQALGVPDIGSEHGKSNKKDDE